MLKKSLIILIFLISIFQALAYAPDWQVELITEIELNTNTLTSQYIAGSDSLASDGNDPGDIPMPPAAPGANLITYSTISPNDYLGEYKFTLNINETKTWELTQEGSREFRREDGLTQIMSWTLTNIPNSLDIKLIDYGEDQNRNTIVAEINLTSEDSYSFDVDRPYNEYRYLNLEVTLTEETCFEDWDCSSWSPSTCPQPGTQTRTCNDLNNCGTTNNKPSEITSCNYICNENWNCPNWSTITCPLSGIKTRTCNDLNNCGTTNNRPTTTTTCTYTCTEDWSCSSWSECQNNQQARICIDDNDCETTNNKPSETKSCVSQAENNNSNTLESNDNSTYENENNEEDTDDDKDDDKCRPEWDCTLWSNCISGLRTRVCKDINRCESNSGKPSETIACKVTVEDLQQTKTNKVTIQKESETTKQISKKPVNIIYEEPNMIIGAIIVLTIIIIGLSVYYIITK